jgi:hypothetical protein
MLTLLLLGCGGGTDPGSLSLATAPSGDGSGAGGGAPASATASVSLAWDRTPDSSVLAHFVYYGKASSGRSGSCKYPHSKHATSNSVTITGLEPDTLYYFAVSAYNGLESPCSNEVSTVTPSAA